MRTWGPSYRFVLVTLAIILLSAPFDHRAAAQSAPPVPAPYQPLYNVIDQSLTAFETTVNAGWNGTLSNVDFAAELTSASSSLGSRLVTPDHWLGVTAELDSLKALGVQAVNVQVAFPVLYSAFHATPAVYQQYADFYSQVATEVRARNLKLIVRSSLIVSQQGFATVDVGAFYRTLTLDQYKSGRIETIQNVVSLMHPDYLVVIGEPDSEASQSGQATLGTVDGSTAFLNAILAALQQTDMTGISVGAGIGVWAPLYKNFVASYAATAVDFIDLHVYPPNRDFLPRLLEIADLAHAQGKGVSVSEAWLQKVADGELGMVPVLTLFGRDPYSFWTPLDTRFLQVMAKTAHYKNLLFLSTFWSQYLHAYLEYNASVQPLPNQLLAMSNSATSDAIGKGEYSSTGVAWARAIATSPDVTAPAIPGGLSTYALSNAAIHVYWTAASDDVGVAGYRVYRNGTAIATTSTLTYQDTGLASATRYSYAVSAFDVAGNESPLSAAVSGTTTSVPDTTPPTIPAGLFGNALSTSQIELNWARSTDNVAVAGYTVFRNGVQVGQTSSPCFSDGGLRAGTTYAYTVAAVDSAGNASAQSVPVNIATYPPDTTPPSQPTSLTVIPARGVIYLVWGPSTDNVSVKAYYVYRNGVRIALAPGPNYQDASVASATTYTYAVLAFDAAGNVSPMSSSVTVTSLDVTRPSVPTGVTGQAISTTQINVSWTASTDNVKVSGYRIFRNGVQIADWGLTSYADRNLAPATWYTYNVAAIDSSGNLSGASPSAHVKTLAPDLTPPSRPTIQAIAAMSTTQINVSWVASTDNVAVVGYRVYRNGVQIASTPGTAWADTGLAPGTTYTYNVTAYDAAGNMSAASAARSATTLRPPDTTPPAVPTGLAVTALARNQVTLAWNASTDNVAVTGYKVFRNTKLIGVSTTPGYVDTGVYPTLTYTYTVAAYDAAGNTSAQSSGITVKTPQ